MEMIKKILYLIAVFACCVLGGNVRIPAEKQAEDQNALQILGQICGLAAADGLSEAKRLMSLDLCEKFDAMDDRTAAKISEVLDAIPR